MIPTVYSGVDTICQIFVKIYRKFSGHVFYSMIFLILRCHIDG